MTRIYLQEVTEWDAPYAVPNHTYIVDDRKEFVYAYIPEGETAEVWFTKPRTFDKRYRKFKIRKAT